MNNINMEYKNGNPYTFINSQPITVHNRVALCRGDPSCGQQGCPHFMNLGELIIFSEPSLLYR